MPDNSERADELSEIDLIEELEYIADRSKMFTKAEMAAVMREAAQEIRELRNVVALHEAVGLANAQTEGNA